MNNYEVFKDELILELTRSMNDVSFDVVNRFLVCLDKIAVTYNIQKQTTEIIAQEEGVPVLVKMFIASKAVEQKTQGTLKNYMLVLTNFFNAVKKSVADVTANDIRVYFHMYQEQRKIKNCTLESMRHAFNSFFSWCYAEEYIPKDPMKRVKQIQFEAKERLFLEPIELEMVREACENIREKAIIDFLFSTGARVSEMCNVKLTNVDFTNRTVFIERGKGGKSRTTYLNAEAIVSLKAYLKSRNDNSPYLFTHLYNLEGDGKLSKKSVEVIIRNLAKRVPSITKDVTPHVIRHTAATIALRNGMPVEQVKELMGHSNINTTMIYAKVNKEDVKRSHSKYLN